jgi:uncharacterized protein YebE (UPF0316 family)
MLSLLVLFLLGIFHDALWALYFRLTAEGYGIASAIASMVITVMSFTIFANLVTDVMQGSYSHLIAYTLGGGIGTYAIVWYRSGDKRA